MFRRGASHFKNSTDRRSTKKLFSKTKLIIFGSVAILLLLIIGIYFLITSPLVKIKNVTVKGEVSCATSEQIISEAKLDQETYIFNTSLKEAQIEKKFWCIRSVGFKKDFPDTVEISVTERKPSLAFGKVDSIDLPNLPGEVEATPSSDSAIYSIDFFVDDSSPSAALISDDTGFLYKEYTGGKKVPFVYASGFNLKLGKLVPEKSVPKILMVLKKLQDLSISYDRLKIIGDNFIVEGETKVLFTFSKDLNEQLASLQLINQKAKMNSKYLDKIDLRFEKPVVVYSNKK